VRFGCECAYRQHREVSEGSRPPFLSPSYVSRLPPFKSPPPPPPLPSPSKHVGVAPTCRLGRPKPDDHSEVLELDHRRADEHSRVLRCFLLSLLVAWLQLDDHPVRSQRTIYHIYTRVSYAVCGASIVCTVLVYSHREMTYIYSSIVCTVLVYSHREMTKEALHRTR
jgi:hypothetical protein